MNVIQTASKSPASRLHTPGITGSGFGGFLTPMNLDELIANAPEFHSVSDPANCLHLNQSLRKQRHGAVVSQCSDCGRNCSNAISQKEMTADQKSSIEPYDYNLEMAGWERREEERKLEKAYGSGFKIAKSGMTQRDEYKVYLQSSNWKEKRRLVIEREGNICQGCKTAPIEEVHHATYGNAGNELLFQLIGLCWPCHRRAHPEKQ